jgi:hypothetical protein
MIGRLDIEALDLCFSTVVNLKKLSIKGKESSLNGSMMLTHYVFMVLVMRSLLWRISIAKRSGNLRNLYSMCSRL